jgi:hypothetical protein
MCRRVIGAAIVLATTVYVGAASAAGGAAEPMPMTNFTDMPSYHPKPVAASQMGQVRGTRSMAPSLPLLRLTAHRRSDHWRTSTPAEIAAAETQL